MRIAALLLLLLLMSACSTDPIWFKANSWFADKPVSEAAPDYIPLAAVPLHPDLAHWSQAQRRKRLQALERAKAKALEQEMISLKDKR